MRALYRSGYSLSRDGIRLRWGMRLEDIPIEEVLWVRWQRQDPARLVFPLLRFPGMVLGMGGRRLEDGNLAEIKVEFLASQVDDLVLIATAKQVYAISPTQAEIFIYTFQEMTHFGSLNPMLSSSVFPTFFPKGVMASLPMRLLFALNILLNLILVGSVMVNHPDDRQIILRYTSAGEPVLPVSAILLWLIPFINIVFSFMEGFLGVFLYRIERFRSLSYMLWITGNIASLLFLGLLYYILHING